MVTLFLFYSGYGIAYSIIKRGKNMSMLYHIKESF